MADLSKKLQIQFLDPGHLRLIYYESDFLGPWPSSQRLDSPSLIVGQQSQGCGLSESAIQYFSKEEEGTTSSPTSHRHKLAGVKNQH